MSSSAALAAAKKRRNVTFGVGANNQNENILSNQVKPRVPVTPQQLLQNHDAQIFKLGHKLNQMTQLLANKDNLDLLPLSSEPKIDNITINKVETNTNEIQSLKNNVNKLIKSLNETNSLVTTLKAALLVQTNKFNELNKVRLDLDQLRSDLNNLVEFVNNSKKIEEVTSSDEVEGDNVEENTEAENTEAENTEAENTEEQSGNQIKLDIKDN